MRGVWSLSQVPLTVHSLQKLADYVGGNCLVGCFLARIVKHAMEAKVPSIALVVGVLTLRLIAMDDLDSLW
jgi:hypothetical protein